MPRPGFADQQDLLNWAQTVSARGDLPRLVRRLVLETGVGVLAIDFPGGEGTAVGGWDGVARTASAAPFVPAGLSLWELSAGQSTSAKAARDYAKRTTTPDGSRTQDATYCALSVRRWGDRRAWAQNAGIDGRWQAVRAFGVDDLEAWLESAPVSHAWVSELLGLNPRGMLTAEGWWQPWTTATNPPITGEVVLAGRAASAEKLRDRLTGHPQLTTLRADSVDEALAFVAAVVMRGDADDRGALLARTAFVDDVTTWRGLADRERALVLVARTPGVIAEARAAARHHVIVPLVGAGMADITLEPIDAVGAAAALREAGLDERRADDAGRLVRRSLLALRRHLAIKPELHTPSWAAAPVDRLVRAGLLAGSWNDEAPGDQECVAELAGRPYEDVREDSARLAGAADPFVTRVDATWAVVSPFDAWRQLESRVRADDLQRLSRVVERVMLEDDPAFPLAPAERWSASLQGRTRRHSSDLRAGLAATIALLGTLGDRIDAGRGATGASLASGIVRALLAAANDDATGAHWAVLSDHLPALAEGGPDALLDGVRAGLAGEPPVLRQIFQDDPGQDPLFSSSSHTGLLWALEAVAWSAEHFAPAVYLLARLAEVDPGGRLANRPANSLASIFCPWHPETTAGVERRLGVLDELRRRHPHVAWALMVALLPETQELHDPTNPPQFREWKPSPVAVTTLQWVEFLSELVGRMIDDAGDDPARWRQLVEECGSVAPSDRARVRAALAGRVDEGSFDQDGRQALWGALRKLIAQHREYPDADWALPPHELDELEATERRLAPRGAADAQAWLFEDAWPDLGDASKTKDGEYDHEGYMAALTERRRAAAAAILGERGWAGVLAVAGRVSEAWMLGTAVADVEGGANAEAVIARLATEDTHELQFALGNVARRFEFDGWSWLEAQLSRPGLSAQQQAWLLLVTHDYPRSWQRADELGAQVADAFWENFSPLGLGSGYPHAAQTARRLLAASRPAAALQLLGIYALRRPEADPSLADVAADALDALLEQPGAALSLRQYDLQAAIAFLEKHSDCIGVDRVARTEWRVLPALGYRPKVPSLHTALAEDATFFVELLSVVYRPRADADTAVSEQERERAANGYRLLSAWSRPPGASADGTFDAAALRSWVHAALSLVDADRRAVAEAHIGQVLAFAPADPDGAWPCVGVRDLLEEIQLERIERGLRRQLYNNRGVTSRGAEEGGDRERSLAQRHRDAAQRFNDRWPRTAVMLRSYAESLEHDARRYEAEAERRRQGLDP